MLRVSTGVAAGIVVGALLLGATGQADTTTTTTTPTTTTTLLPHPFSDATATCVHQARADQRACRRTGGTDCFTAFVTAFANCFAPGAGGRARRSA